VRQLTSREAKGRDIRHGEQRGLKDLGTGKWKDIDNRVEKQKNKN